MSSFFGFPMHQPSEEEMEEIRHARERQEMAIEDFKHSSQRMFDELTEDHLRSLKTMLHILTDRTGDPLAATWEGVVSTYLKIKFNVCITCGVNHDHEAPRPDPVEDEIKRPAPTEEDPAVTGIPLREPLTFPPTVRETMIEYHLDDVYEEVENGVIFLGFRCTGIKGMRNGCGMTYPTLNDRVINEPEHCSGCFRKMAQG